MKIKNIIIGAILIAVCFLCGCRSNQKETVKTPEVTGDFSFTILKAGQADAIFLQTQNHSMIIDCGEEDDGDKLSNLILEKGITNVDYLFITHFDKDHVGGFPELIGNVSADNIIVPDYVGNNDEYEVYKETIEDENLTITPLKEDTAFTLDDVLFEVSVPKKKNYKEGDNDFSIVISVTHGENTFLFAADAEEGRLPEVISEFGKEYDFLKVPHHGKHSEHTKRFINTIKPEYAVVCDSQKNPASKKTMSLLESVGAKIYSTKDGNVFALSNGKEIKISQNND